MHDSSQLARLVYQFEIPDGQAYSGQSSAEERDRLVCQKARGRIESLAFSLHADDCSFREQYRCTAARVLRIAEDATLQIHLNPVRCWAKLISRALLPAPVDPPANVLFFAAAGEIGTAILELEGQTLLNELADFAPCTLAEWSALTQLAGRSDLSEFTRDLAEIGLVSISQGGLGPPMSNLLPRALPANYS